MSIAEKLEEFTNVSAEENARSYRRAATILVKEEKQLPPSQDLLQEIWQSYSLLSDLVADADESKREQIKKATRGIVIGAIKFYQERTGRKDFENIVRELADLFTRKNADYENSFRFWGIPGLVVRVGDKYFRVAKLAKKDYQAKVASEKIEETLKDLANYGIMLLMLLDEGRSLRWGE